MEEDNKMELQQEADKIYEEYKKIEAQEDEDMKQSEEIKAGSKPTQGIYSEQMQSYGYLDQPARWGLLSKENMAKLKGRVENLVSRKSTPRVKFVRSGKRWGFFVG